MTDAATAPPIVPEDDDEDLPSYLDFRPTGGIHLVIEGEKRRLRAPRMRDYRRLYEAWAEEAEPLDAKSAELTDFLQRVTDPDRPDPKLTDEERAEDKRLGQEIRRMTEDAAIRWWTETIQTLGVTDADKALDPDDLPTFLATADAVTQALTHWRSVPSRSGAR